VTSFAPSTADPERALVDELEIIDLHHGPYSSGEPYTALKVIGARLSAGVREALADFGFTGFTEDGEGFVAHRTPEAAGQLRAWKL
jgi:hypothetical protein